MSNEMFKWDSVVRFSSIQFIIVIFSFLFVSCATHRDAAELRNDLNALSNTTESRLYVLEKSVASLDRLINEHYMLSQSIRSLIGAQTQELRDNSASITARQDEINYQLRELHNKLQAIQLYGGVDTKSFAEESAPTSDKSISEKPSPSNDKTLVVKTKSGTIEVKPEELYKSAIEDINKGNYALAEGRLLTFLIQFPEHELTSSAQYWLGETAYGQQKYELAIEEFDKLLKKYNKSQKIPAALLTKGLAQIESGQKKSAQSTLKRLVSSYPKSEESKEAREILKSL